MSIEVVCDCGHVADAGDHLAGGIMNCPACGRAIEVPGLNDPLWRLAQAVAAVIWAGGTALAYAAGGPLAAGLTAIILASAFWLISRFF